MAQASRKATQVAKSIGTKATDSTIAALPGRTDTATVRAARQPGLKTGLNFTAQYLYDRFVNDKAANKEDITKMELVSQMVEVLDVSAFDSTVGGMVKLASDAQKAAIQAAKDAGNYDSENPSWTIREAGARLNTARAHQTVMRTAFGLLKFCADELHKKVGDVPLAYRMVRELGAKMLKDKGIDWKGNKLPAPADVTARKEQETETAAMLAVQKEMPRKENESRAAYFARIDAATEAKMKELRAADEVKAKAALAEKVRALCGANLPDILELLMSGDNKQEQAKATADKNLH